VPVPVHMNARLTLPRPSDRCRDLAVKDHTQGRRGLCVVADATGGSALECDLCAARGCPARRTGHARILQPRSSGQRNGGYRRPAGAGQPTWRRRARPSGLPPERARHGRRPESDSGPPLPPPLVLAVVPVSLTHSRSMTSRPCVAYGPRPGRWRAGGAPLKPYRRSAQIRVRVPLSVFPVLTSGATPPGKRLRLGPVPGGGLAAYGPAPPPARAPQDPFQTLRGKHLEAPPLRAEPLRTLGQESRAGSSLPQPARGPHPPP
jgi:hypothetical protein